MACSECGNLNPGPDPNSTGLVCNKCHSPTPPKLVIKGVHQPNGPESLLITPTTMSRRSNYQTIEERSFQAVLVCLELHFAVDSGLGPKTMPEVKKMLGQTLDMSLNKADVRFDSSATLSWMVTNGASQGISS